MPLQLQLHTGAGVYLVFLESYPCKPLCNQTFKTGRPLDGKQQQLDVNLHHSLPHDLWQLSSGKQTSNPIPISSIFVLLVFYVVFQANSSILRIEVTFNPVQTIYTFNLLTYLFIDFCC